MFRVVRLRLVAFALLAGLLAAACGPPSPASLPTQLAGTSTAAPTSTVSPSPTPASNAITLTDSLGRKVTLAGPARRIVTLAPSNTEILFALGAGGALVGRDDISDYPPEAAAVPSIGSLYPSVNAEAVVALQPDLVLAAGITNPEDVKRLADLGLTVYSTSIATGLEDIYNDILAVGELVGRSTEAAAVVTGLRARVAVVTAKSAGVSTRPVVFYEIDATDPSKPWTAGPNTFHDQLISMAGGTNAGNIAKDQYFQLSLEELVSRDPAVIVLGSATYGGQTPELVAARAGWQNIKAVKEGAVYTFDDNVVSRPGPRVVDGLETLARLIHPELFK